MGISFSSAIISHNLGQAIWHHTHISYPPWCDLVARAQTIALVWQPSLTHPAVIVSTESCIKPNGTDSLTLTHYDIHSLARITLVLLCIVYAPSFSEHFRLHLREPILSTPTQQSTSNTFSVCDVERQTTLLWDWRVLTVSCLPHGCIVFCSEPIVNSPWTPWLPSNLRVPIWYDPLHGFCCLLTSILRVNSFMWVHRWMRFNSASCTDVVVFLHFRVNICRMPSRSSNLMTVFSVSAVIYFSVHSPSK